MSDSPRPSTERHAYPSDVTNRQWEEIELLLPSDSRRGRTRECSLREVVNAVNYRWLTGCSWRMLPHDFPHWQTVYSYFRQWQRLGLLSGLREILISRSLRMKSSQRQVPVSSESQSDPQTAVSPASKTVRTTSPSELDSSSWPARSSCSHSRS